MAEYPRPSFTVDAVVLAGSGESMSLLAITRAKDPFAGQLALPGGFVEEQENLLAACLRELREETALDLSDTYATPLCVRAKAKRDPRGWTMSQPFLFHLEEPRKVKSGDDASAAQWVPLGDLKELAFDHGSILCEALGKFWSDMPSAAPHLMGIQAFGAPPVLPGRAVFFGGSFKPVHEGHRECVRGLKKPQSTIVVPDQSPFKQLETSEHRCSWSSYQQLRAFFGEDVLAVFPGFWGMERPNPTASWLPFVATESIAMLVGEDSMETLPTWFDAEQLVSCLDDIYVVPRQGDPSAYKAAKKWLNQQNPDCRLQRLAEHPHQDKSSSKLRQS